MSNPTEKWIYRKIYTNNLGKNMIDGKRRVYFNNENFVEEEGTFEYIENIKKNILLNGTKLSKTEYTKGIYKYIDLLGIYDIVKGRCISFTKKLFFEGDFKYIKESKIKQTQLVSGIKCYLTDINIDYDNWKPNIEVCEYKYNGLYTYCTYCDTMMLTEGITECKNYLYDGMYLFHDEYKVWYLYKGKFLKKNDSITLKGKFKTTDRSGSITMIDGVVIYKNGTKKYIKEKPKEKTLYRELINRLESERYKTDDSVNSNNYTGDLEEKWREQREQKEREQREKEQQDKVYENKQQLKYNRKIAERELRNATTDYENSLRFQETNLPDNTFYEDRLRDAKNSFSVAKADYPKKHDDCSVM